MEDMRVRELVYIDVPSRDSIRRGVPNKRSGLPLCLCLNKGSGSQD